MAYPHTQWYGVLPLIILYKKLAKRGVYDEAIRSCAPLFV